jgi:putative flavoprotein involved in K+ transport
MEAVIVIGGGPAGLAAAAALKQVGVDALVLDRGAHVGDSWRAHYDRLHLHTARRLSALPGMAIPSAYGQWVARDDVVRYLEAYAAHHALRVELGIAVEQVERAGDGWRLATSRGERSAERVVVATGYNHTPLLPEWPGLKTFSGEILHASRYKNAAPYRGRDVLVVGPGNSGAEIAVDLVERNAARVRLAVRTPPNILRRSLGGLPSQAVGIALRPLPPRVVDPLIRGVQRLTVGDLSRFGLGRSPRGTYARILDEGQFPVLDVGLIDAVKSGRVEVVGAVERLEGGEVVLAGGARISPAVVIAATGFLRGLEPLVGHLGLLSDRGFPRVHGAVTDPGAPGLHFIGYTNPVSGNLREIAIDARRIARAVRGQRRA